MTTKPAKRVRCAVYTRVSTEYGLDQEFNSLDAQHEAAEAYIRSQAHDGWTLIRTRYDDGGYSGGSTERPALQRLLADIRDRRIDIVVVYKVDRLTRSLADFAKLVEAGFAMEAGEAVCLPISRAHLVQCPQDRYIRVEIPFRRQNYPIRADRELGRKRLISEPIFVSGNPRGG
jgi:Resolvase, N terminal domain